MLSHVAELHGHQKLQIGATWIHTYILWVLPLYTVLLPIENIALPWRPRWYCSPSSKTMTAFIHSCANIVLGTAKCWGYSRVQSSKSRHLMCLIGKTQLLCMQCRGIGPHLVAWGSLMDFLELRQARGVYSRVVTGMPILNGSLFSEVRTLV